MQISKIEPHIDNASSALQDAQEAVTEALAREEEGKEPRVKDTQAAKVALQRAAREVAAALKAAS